MTPPTPRSGRVSGLSGPFDSPATQPGWGADGGALLLIAHGSRDVRHAATMADIVAATGLARPDLDVRLAYLDHHGPRVPELLTAMAADGHRVAVAVPLLLGHAFHARVDIPAALAEGSAACGVAIDLVPVLGPDPALLPAALRRLRAAGGRPGPGTGVVLACAGTTDPLANAALARLVLRWRRTLGADVRIANAAANSTGIPTVGGAVSALRAGGARRVDVATWFLAPGVLLDRACADALSAGADSVAAPLGAASEVVDTLLRRFDATAARAAQVA